MTQVVVDGILFGALYGLIGVSLTIIFGVMGVINFAHGDFLMIGMYVVFFAVTGLSLEVYASSLVVVPLVAILGACVFWLVVQPVLDASDDHAQLLTTFGASLILENVALAWFTPRSRAQQTHGIESKLISWGNVTVPVSEIIAFCISLLVLGAIWGMLQKSYAGRLIRAAAEDRDAARLCGINVTLVYFSAFVLGIACLGVAAVLFSPMYYVSPAVGPFLTLVAFVVVAIGGLGSYVGALIGGFVVGLAQTFGAYLLPGSYDRVVLFSVFLLILVFRPRGLFGVGKL